MQKTTLEGMKRMSFRFCRQGLSLGGMFLSVRSGTGRRLSIAFLDLSTEYFIQVGNQIQSPSEAMKKRRGKKEKKNRGEGVI